VENDIGDEDAIVADVVVAVAVVVVVVVDDDDDDDDDDVNDFSLIVMTAKSWCIGHMYYYLSPSILDKDADMVKEIGCNNAIMITMCTGLYILAEVVVILDVVAVAVVAEVVVILDVVMVVVVVID